MNKTNKYQNELSTISPILLDIEHKTPKVKKMLAILAEAGAINKSKELAIDIGCSAGYFTFALSPYFEKVIGIDIDKHALEIAKNKSYANNITYTIADSMNLPFHDNSVDLVICNHVYEHVPDSSKLFSEIKRVLKNDGCCYLGAASRLTLIEPHYHLPLLSWLPKIIADKYMQITGKGNEYYENLLTYWGIRRLIKDFEVQDFTMSVIEDPDKYCARDMIPKNGFLSKIPMSMWKAFFHFLPSYLFILRK